MLPMPIGEIRGGEVIKLSLLTKSSAWCNEQEYRLINMPTYADSSGERITGRVLDDLFHWPSGPQASHRAGALSSLA